jgi:hypothetical protein
MRHIKNTVLDTWPGKWAALFHSKQGCGGSKGNSVKINPLLVDSNPPKEMY